MNNLTNDEIRLANRISDRRRQLGLEQQVTARVAGITPEQWGDIENGKLRILDEWLPSIAAVLGCTVVELLGDGELPEGELRVLEDSNSVIFISPGALERYAQSAAGHHVYPPKPAE
ncbi:MAG: helix-turn-helix transcriptional regulator [Caldilineaceae bacterium]|nr:helix-turn-helix transcriptional regulator [Caldilineaceae bacterium]